MAYDIEETLDIEGHDVVKVSYPISSYVADKGFNDYIVRILDKDNFDCIFTMIIYLLLRKYHSCEK